MAYPVHKTKHSAGADWETQEDITFYPFTQVLVRTGVFIPEGTAENTFFLLAPRSSTFKKYKLIQTNSVGILDADYPNEILAPLLNLSMETITIPKGTSLGQLVNVNYNQVFDVLDVERLDGFGHTDRNQVS